MVPWLGRRTLDRFFLLLSCHPTDRNDVHLCLMGERERNFRLPHLCLLPLLRLFSLFLRHLLPLCLSSLHLTPPRDLHPLHVCPPSVLPFLQLSALFLLPLHRSPPHLLLRQPIVRRQMVARLSLRPAVFCLVSLEGFAVLSGDCRSMVS